MPRIQILSWLVTWKLQDPWVCMKYLPGGDEYGWSRISTRWSTLWGMNMIGQYYQGVLSKTSFLWILRYFGSFPSDAPYLSKIYAEEVCETIVSSFWAFFSRWGRLWQNGHCRSFKSQSWNVITGTGCPRKKWGLEIFSGVSRLKSTSLPVRKT